MTWTAPMTAVDTNYLTASQFNTYVRDNLNECAPAKVTSSGYFFVPTGTNKLDKRQPLTSYTTTEIQFTGGGTVQWVDGGGPSVSTVTGTSALVFIGSYTGDSADQSGSGIAYEITGATSLLLSALDPTVDGFRSVLTDGISGGGAGTPGSNAPRTGICYLQTGLTAGTNTFTMKYLQHSSGTTSYRNREILIIPL